MRFLRFPDLRDSNIAKSWAQLKRLIDNYGFPPGRMISPNIRAWTDVEVDEWVQSRPTAGPALKGAAKVRRERSRLRKAAENSADNSADSTDASTTAQ